MENFQRVRKLGEGTFGEVWKCLDRERKHGQVHVALKLMKFPAPEAFLIDREVRLLRACHGHPNVVRLHDAFKSERSGRFCMVMEHLDSSLRQQLWKYPKGLPASQTKLLMWQLLQATSFLHRNQVMHRDLKPDNILLSFSGVLKLCDFGLARHTAPAGQAANYTPYVITRYYRAPEVLVGGTYGTPADIWSIGCILGEMVQGRPLLQGRSSLDQLILSIQATGPLPEWQARLLDKHKGMSALVAKHTVSHVQPSLQERFPLCDPRLIEVLQACLQPEPAHRMSAEQLLRLPYFDDVPQLVQGKVLQNLYGEQQQQQQEQHQQPAKGDVLACGAHPANAVAAAAAAPAKPSVCASLPVAGRVGSLPVARDSGAALAAGSHAEQPWPSREVRLEAAVTNAAPPRIPLLQALENAERQHRSNGERRDGAAVSLLFRDGPPEVRVISAACSRGYSEPEMARYRPAAAATAAETALTSRTSGLSETAAAPRSAETFSEGRQASDPGGVSGSSLFSGSPPGIGYLSAPFHLMRNSTAAAAAATTETKGRAAATVATAIAAATTTAAAPLPLQASELSGGSSHNAADCLMPSCGSHHIIDGMCNSTLATATTATAAATSHAALEGVCGLAGQFTEAVWSGFEALLSGCFLQDVWQQAGRQEPVKTLQVECRGAVLHTAGCDLV